MSEGTMKRVILMMALFLPSVLCINAQESKITETASLEQVYGQIVTSQKLKSFNEINMEFGYVLYETEISIAAMTAELELENVRDYAAVYIDSSYQGSVTDNEKKITLSVKPGKHKLLIYAENIGRITYGPEILDNSKGLFGKSTLDGEEITDWKITPLKIKETEPGSLKFEVGKKKVLPALHKAIFQLDVPKSTYLDMSGWGMGEVWINGQYLGSFWEKEKLQSIQVLAEILKKGSNEIIIFDLKNTPQTSVKLVDQPVFNQ